MDEVEQQILQCVASVFPNLETHARPMLNQETLAEWDSIAHVTLIAALSEAFDFDFEAFVQATSVARVVAKAKEQLKPS